MRTPDITPAQIIGAVMAATYPLLTLIGVDLSPQQVNALDDLGKIAIGLFGADAAIRVGRNISLKNRLAAGDRDPSYPSGEAFGPKE